jgi:hypothetical protein
MGQKDGEKWTAAVDLQPTILKSDRLLGRHPKDPRAQSGGSVSLNSQVSKEIRL